MWACSLNIPGPHLQFLFDRVNDVSPAEEQSADEGNDPESLKCKKAYIEPLWYLSQKTSCSFRSPRGPFQFTRTWKTVEKDYKPNVGVSACGPKVSLMGDNAERKASFGPGWGHKREVRIAWIAGNHCAALLVFRCLRSRLYFILAHSTCTAWCSTPLDNATTPISSQFRKWSKKVWI